MSRGLPLFLLIACSPQRRSTRANSGRSRLGVLFALWLITLHTTKQASATRRREDLTPNGQTESSGPR